MQLTPINKHFSACDQQWDDMPQKDNGRHCQQCDRVLVDLTDKTEHQVLELQIQSNFTMCAKYTLDQVHRLDRYLTLKEQPKRSHMPWLVKLAMGLGTSGLPMLAAAQEPLPAAWIEQPYPKDTTIEIYPGYHSPWVKPQQEDLKIISGIVKDTDGEPIPFVNVTIVDVAGNVLAGAASDFDGDIQMRYQAEWLAAGFVLKFNALGYEDLEMNLTDAVVKNEFELPSSAVEFLGVLVGFIKVDPDIEVEIDNYRVKRSLINGAETYYFNR